MLICLPTMADASQEITPDAGDGEVFLRGGAAQQNRDWTWIADGGIRIGLPHGLEIATPLALSWAPLRERPFEVAITMGITDFWPTTERKYLYTPSVVVSSRAHFSHEAAALFAIDYTHVQENFRHSPGFIRGAGALMVDMGPYLTWCIGLSYQHILVDRPLPSALSRSGFAGKQRVSIGSVRATPFSDVPLFAIHTRKHLDITINARFDIDSETTNTRLEGGLLFFW